MTNKKIVKPDLAIQKDVGTKTSDGTTLKNIWLELPGYCNLACSYCYAEGGKPKDIKNLLNWDDYVSILEQAKEMGVEDIGIPGAGEPLLPRNRNLTFRFLEKCKKEGFYVTLFTTGEWIDGKTADRLYDLPVEVMIKGNSLKPEVQDAFVSDPKRGRNITGYGQKRNETLKLLMSKGFNDEEKCMKKYGRKSRMALVTSIMDSETGPSNYEEIGKIQDYARENNIIFDVDSVLERGRGAGCELCTADKRIKSKLQELQERDAKRDPPVEWELSQSYIGTVCDRFSYHMYINQWGDIRPCIGAMDVNLGNVKENTLEQAWESHEMRIIRSRNYKGKCGDKCANFSEIDKERTAEAGTLKYKCNSCLGRRTENLTNKSLLENGYVSTIGCWNHRPKE